MKEEKRYKAKRDYLIAIVLTVLIAAIVCFAIFASREVLWTYILILSVLGIILILVLISTFRTYYVLKEDYLLIVSGIFRKKISYRRMESVEENRSAWSSLCLSFERIKIKTGKSFVFTEYIAPIERAEVIAELKERIKVAKEEYESYLKDDENE